VSNKASNIPPVPQIRERILHNIDRVQGFLDILVSEIHDPAKICAGPRQEWLEETKRLEEALKHLKRYLAESDREVPHE